MPAPVLVLLTGDYIESTCEHLLAAGVSVTVEVLADALHAAARHEVPASSAPSLFGGES